MRVFIAGIIQGSMDSGIGDQGYRATIADLVKTRFPDAEVVDIWVLHPNCAGYGPEEERQAFGHMNAEAARCDLLVAYLPSASMGTAIEIWEAHNAGRRVVTISPLRDNWVVRFLSDVVVGDLQAFREFVERGGIEELLSAPTADSEMAARERELFGRALDRWGLHRQALLIFEELAEFQQRVAHLLRGRCTVREFVEEYTDMVLMLVNLSVIVGRKCPDFDFEGAVAERRLAGMDRLRRRLRTGDHFEPITEGSAR
jgi:hypothetical protein